MPNEIYIKLGENRIGTHYVRDYMEAYNEMDQPYFRWRNIDVYREFCYWKKENNL